MTQNSIDNKASIIDVTNIRLDANTISSTDTDGDIILAPDGGGNLEITAAPIVPSTDRVDSLGSATNSWKGVFANGFTFDDGTNTISAYERGQLDNMVVAFGGASVGVTYDQQRLVFIRIGDIVFFRIEISLSSKGTSTGDFTIEGLPFTSANDGIETAYESICRSTSHTTGATQFFCILDPNSTSLRMRDVGSNANAALQDTNVQDTSPFRVNGYYWLT